MHYCLGFKVGLEVKQGLMESLTSMVKDTNEQTLIDIQIDDFKRWAKYFGRPLATRSINLKTLIVWWESHGHEHLNYQNFSFMH